MRHLAPLVVAAVTVVACLPPPGPDGAGPGAEEPGALARDDGVPGDPAADHPDELDERASIAEPAPPPRRPDDSVGSSHLRGEPAPIERAEPVAEADFLSPIERDLARALDGLRRDPPGYARALAAHRARFDGALVTVPGESVPIRTFEGPAAVDEAIAAVRRTAPMASLAVSPALSAVARRHAAELGAAGTLDHTSADGRQPHERIESVGRLDGRSGENIGTGYADGGMMLLSLVVDDGVPSRGHRRNLLEPAFRVVGIGCARHRAYRFVCVMDLAESFRE